jgi:hypothetical protein
MPLYNPTDSDNRTTITTAAPEREAEADTYIDQGEWLGRIESLILRYPWPTLFLALGVGYALSRRMR